MAKIGLKYPVYAGLTETTTAAYTAGAVIAKAIQANITINTNDVKLYADDGLAESDTSFKDGTISFGVDNLSSTVYKALLSHTDEAPEATLTDTEAKEIIAKSTDNPGYFGVGFYGTIVNGGVKSYRAVFLKKVQFKEVNDENQTRGETVDFKTVSLEGTIYQDVENEWKREITVNNEADAIAWLNDKVAITA